MEFWCGENYPQRPVMDRMKLWGAAGESSGREIDKKKNGER